MTKLDFPPESCIYEISLILGRSSRNINVYSRFLAFVYL